MYFQHLLAYCRDLLPGGRSQVYLDASIDFSGVINMSGKRRILFVLSSHPVKGSTGKPTGYYLSEASHPWHELKLAGYEVEFVSPAGGEPPVDGYNLDDPINREFVEHADFQEGVRNSLHPSAVDPDRYVGIFYAGGHGAAWDFADNVELARIGAQIYEAGGVVGAVCHGVAGLVNIRLSSGALLVAGKRVNSFTNEEEQEVGLANVVPFLLEDKLKAQGADFRKSLLWQAHVESDRRVVTGQNPASARPVGAAMVDALQAN
jgi:putative intracellular protease/amidase